MSTAQELRPADLVSAAWKSRREDLEAMLLPNSEHLEIEKSGTGYTLSIAEREVNASITDDEMNDIAESLGIDLADDDDMGIMKDEIASAFFCQYQSQIEEAASEAFDEYGLDFGYVERETFPCQPEGYWRYQISWGGPSQEIRFYGNVDGSLNRAEFWHLDWYDGAAEMVTDDDVAIAVWRRFESYEMLQSTFDHATRS